MYNNSLYSGNVIDIEASGLHPGSYPIEVGIVLSNGRTYEALIQPFSSWTHWDSNAELLHGISREMLKREGRDAFDVCNEINQLCAGKTLYSDCSVYDSSWIKKLFTFTNIPPKFHCASIETVLSEDDLINWNMYKREYARFAQINPHRALNDAITISETLERLVVDLPFPGIESPAINRQKMDRFGRQVA